MAAGRSRSSNGPAAGRAGEGRDAEVVGAGGWMDSAFLAAAGIPTVIFGPIGEGAHADVEWVDLESAAQPRMRTMGNFMKFCA